MTSIDPQPAEWPERIYCVCNSTFGAVVKATPIVHAGANRIAGMQVFCGVRDQRSRTPED